jgi:hypothetical protein
MIFCPRRAKQRGSALLIVFVFAAMLAIMLYREMPVVAFEAQRQKEELLMDRGNEYKHAIKLYVRKFQTFPPTIAALENTNRMRFLRNKYVDPFTGKADWRLLHAGPGGIILDSQIKQKTTGIAGTGANGATASSNPFGSSGGFGSSATTADLAAAVGGGSTIPQRAPAVSVNGGGASNGDLPFPVDTSQSDSQQSTPSVPSPGIPYPGYPGPPTAPIPGQTSSATDLSQAGSATTNPIATSSGPFPTSNSGRFRNSSGPLGNSYPPGQSAVDPNLQAASQAPNAPDQQNTIQSLLNNQNPQPTLQFGSTNNSATTTIPATSAQSSNSLAVAGGIAGVASISHGHTIKVLNDQTERHLWEFVYDMQKEAAANAPGLGGRTGTNSTAGTNSPLGAPGNSSGFGSGGQTSNQSNTFGSGLGNSNNPSSATGSPNQ